MVKKVKKRHRKLVKQYLLAKEFDRSVAEVERVIELAKTQPESNEVPPLLNVRDELESMLNLSVFIDSDSDRERDMKRIGNCIKKINSMYNQH